MLVLVPDREFELDSVPNVRIKFERFELELELELESD